MLALSGACGRASCGRAHRASPENVMPRIVKVGAAALGTGPWCSAGPVGPRRTPDVASGHVVQVPLHAPINACGNTVDVIGFLNPAVGNRCVNDGHNKHHPGYGN
ncbi:chaplin [Streptomyces hirsutus]|uniref:chaplin n=1 Tax=Streptomyces hirsutus TaxID=35620 RepID=UPI0036B16248